MSPASSAWPVDRYRRYRCCRPRERRSARPGRRGTRSRLYPTILTRGATWFRTRSFAKDRPGVARDRQGHIASIEYSRCANTCRAASSAGSPRAQTNPLTIILFSSSPSRRAERGSRLATSLVTVDFPAPGIPVTIRQLGVPAVSTTGIVSACLLIGKQFPRSGARRVVCFAVRSHPTLRWRWPGRNPFAALGSPL